MFDNLKADFRRYADQGTRPNWLRLYFDHQGLWALVCYRFGRHLEDHRLPPVVHQLVKAFYHLWWKSVQITTGIYIPSDVKIGPGLYIGHFGQIFVGPDVEIGANCNISQGVALGLAKRGGEWGVPKLGDRVYVAPGAKVVGPISIGNGVVIGANAVMSKDAPENTVWAGIPARIIGHSGSEDYMVGNNIEDRIF